MTTVTVNVDVDVDLREIDEALLQEETQRRRRRRYGLFGAGPMVPPLAERLSDMAGDLRDAFMARDVGHFDVLLMRLERLDDEPREVIKGSVAVLPGMPA